MITNAFVDLFKYINPIFQHHQCLSSIVNDIQYRVVLLHRLFVLGEDPSFVWTTLRFLYFLAISFYILEPILCFTIIGCKGKIECFYVGMRLRSFGGSSSQSVTFINICLD